MSKPHVLMLTPYLPYPPVSGGRMRTYNLIKHLSADYDIRLVCFGRPEETALDHSPIGAYCAITVVDRDPTPSTIKAAILSLTSPKPITMKLYGTDAMRQACVRLLKDCPADVIHVESFYMLQNIPADLDTPVLLSEPAIEYRAWGKHAKVAQPWFTRPAIALEAMKMRFWSPREWRKADKVGAMSDVDAAEIGRFVPEERIVIAPNGVDVNFFQTNAEIERDSRTAIYMGDYKYFPNTDAVMYFAKEILPLIQAKRPDFHLTLLGKDPSPEIQALAGEHVTVTGLVEDTRPYLQGSALFVCPLRSGSGTRFKLMESLACGCPVVSTSLGCEGLGAKDGVHMLIRDDAQAFADAVIELLDNPQRGQAMGRAGREWVIQTHAWEHSAALVREAYQQMIKEGSFNHDHS